MEPQWPTHIARRVSETIRADVEAMISTSRLARKNNCIALVEKKDIQIGRLLGAGSFSEVHEVQLGGGRRVAIKYLKRELLEQPENFRLAAGELAVEAHMLAAFDHPNIIKIRGWAASGVHSFAQGRNDSFFLLLDCLDETLEQRLEKWEKQSVTINRAVSRPLQHEFIDFWRRLNSGYNSPMDQMATEIHLFHIKHEEEMYLEKLRICGEIASALAYLHENRVIYRDLKRKFAKRTCFLEPSMKLTANISLSASNIGFLNNRVQLFDFGLSRELPSPSLDEPFLMSGKIGTLRYMAVEVACLQPYNVAADVYSWAMVAYEIMALTKPFSGWTRDMHSQMVCGMGARPPLNHHDGVFVAPSFQAILQRAWHQMPHMRPSIAAVRNDVQLLEHQQMQLVLELMKSNQFQQSNRISHDRAGRQAPSRTSSSCTSSTAMTNESWD
jgi:serine/threonine protein kinase